jgi:NADH-quinone oxidoreductase subunit L
MLTRASMLFNDNGIDGAVNNVATAVARTSVRLRRLQTGFARTYGLSMLAGATVIVAALLMVRS